MQDSIKVATVNLTALAFSLTDVETVIRIGGLLVALIYTTLKAYYLVVEHRERKKP